LEVASRLLWKSKELESHILQLIVALLTFKSLLFMDITHDAGRIATVMLYSAAW
jgi:hypothetical protein